MRTEPVKIPFHSLLLLQGCSAKLLMHHHKTVRIDRLVFTSSAPNGIRVKDWLVGKQFTSLSPDGTHTKDDKERAYSVRCSTAPAEHHGGEAAYAGMTMSADIVNDSPAQTEIHGYAEGVVILGT